MTSPEIFFLIGNETDYSNFKQNTNNIDNLPVKNLPMTYFPFYYNNSETSIQKMNRLVPLIKNNIKTKENVDGAQETPNTIDTDKLFLLLTNMEESYQPFNNNLIFHIKMFIIVIWILLFLGILKLVAYYLNENYSYFIIVMIILLLVMATIWTFVVTSKNF